MMTKSRGMNIVLNFLSGNAFLAALRTLGNNGEFYNFSKTDMKNQLNIGIDFNVIVIYNLLIFIRSKTNIKYYLILYF